MKQFVLVQDLQKAHKDLASLKQARQAGQAAIVASQMQLEEAALPSPSSLQVTHLSKPTLCCDFASVLTMMPS